MTKLELKDLFLSIFTEQEIRDKYQWKLKLQNDKKWATSDCDYHKNLRKRLNVEVDAYRMIVDIINLESS